MVVTIQFKGSLRDRRPSSDRYLGEDRWDIPEGSTLGRILQMLRLSEQEAAIFFINGKRVDKDYAMKEGDDLEVFSPISGG